MLPFSSRSKVCSTVPTTSYPEIKENQFSVFFQQYLSKEDPVSEKCMVMQFIKQNDLDGLGQYLKQRNITSLDLKDCSLDSQDAKVIAEFLKGDKTLLAINLSENQFGEDGLSSICSALKENAALTDLILDHNDFSKTVPRNAIAETIAENRTLRKLTLRCCSIGAEGTAVLAKGLQKNRSLNQLSLVGNSLGDEGISSITSSLKNNDSLKFLDLSSNRAGPESGKLLAGMLKEKCRLTTLNISDNTLGSDGAAPILAALKNNTVLRNLFLYHAGLDNRSAAPIASLLQENTTLSWLDFSSNKIFVPVGVSNNDAIDCIVHGLEHNTVVINLDLKWNHPIHQSIVGRPPMYGEWGMKQAGEDIGRIDNLLERNRTLDALSTKDAYVCSQLFPGQQLSMDEGKVLASAMIITAPGIAAYDVTMLEIQCCVNVLAAQT